MPPVLPWRLWCRSRPTFRIIVRLHSWTGATITSVICGQILERMVYGVEYVAIALLSATHGMADKEITCRHLDCTAERRSRGGDLFLRERPTAARFLEIFTNENRPRKS